jgi:hypothetical protein
MNAHASRHAIGGNNPPVKELLGTAYADLLVAVDEAVASAGRAPDTISDDATLGKFGDLIRHLTKLGKDADKARKDEKEPFLTAGRDVDGFFNPLVGALDDAKRKLSKPHTAYLAAKEAEERAKREAAEKSAREEEEARLRAAEAAQDSGNFDEADKHLALASEAEARAVEAGANLKPAELVRTYSSGGSVSTLKKEWTFAVESYDAVPLDTLRPYISTDAVDKAIRAFVKAGGRQLAGVRIYEAAKSMVR